MAELVTICKQFTLEAAHQLPNHDGKCARLHGHTYMIELFVEGSVRPVDLEHPHPKEGMVVDFGVVSKAFKEYVFDVMDHNNLNEVLPIPVTTAENISKWIYDTLDFELSSMTYRLKKVRVWETRTGYAEYAP